MGNLTLVAKVVGKCKTIKPDLHGKQVIQVKVGQTVRIQGVFPEVNGRFLEISHWKDIELVEFIR